MAPSSSKDKRRYEGPVAQVLMEDSLLGCIFGFLRRNTARQRVKVLGQLGLVCRTWREVACWEKRWWAGIRQTVMPFMGRGVRRGKGNRACLMQYGRMLVEERRVWGFDNWTDGLELHFEVFDHGDGMQLLSAGGTPIFCSRGEEDYELQLRNDASLYSGVPVRFSPKDRGCEDIVDFTQHTWLHDNEPGLCVRVTMSDRRTGRRVLLWEEGKGTNREPETEPDDEGTFSIVSQWNVVVQSTPPHLNLECSTGIAFWSELDEEGMAEEDKLYSLSAGPGEYTDGEGHLRLIFRGDDVLRVPSWIRSLLATEH